MRDEGLTVHTGLAYRRIERTGEGIAMTIEAERKLEVLQADPLLPATGRQPNTAGLGPREAGVELDARAPRAAGLGVGTSTS